MKNNSIRITAAALAAVLALSCSGCGKTEPVISETPTTVPTTAAPTTAAPVRYDNPLTGAKDMETTNNRPVAFMIDNYSAAIRQKHIDLADMYVEAETEAGIPRIMAVFSSIDRVPSEVGPCRSARTHFVKMAKALDTIYCHVGGSTLGRAMIKEKKVTDLNSLVTVSPDLKAVNGAIEHTKVFTLKSMKDAIAKRKISTTTKTVSPFAFGEKAGDTPVTAVQINISANWRVSFTYDAASKLYTKHRNVLSSAEHVSYEGNPITATNIIIMYDKRFSEDSQHISFELNSGAGTLISGGTCRDIRWKRTDSQLRYTETDGTPLVVSAGKTYICITSADLKGKTVLQA